MKIWGFTTVQYTVFMISMTILMYLSYFTSPVLFLTFFTFYTYDKICRFIFFFGWGESKGRLKFWEYIGKPKILCAALILLSFTGFQMPNCEFSCSSSDGEEPAYSAGDPGSIPGSERSSGEGNGNQPQHSCLGNPVDRGAWLATVHGITESDTT